MIEFKDLRIGESVDTRNCLRIHAGPRTNIAKVYGWNRDEAELIAGTIVRGLRVLEAVSDIGDDYMTSEVHHPDHVLIPREKFELILSLLENPA